MAAPGYFPLLVEGSWGPDPPKSLITKLQLYFQSQKRSGGGECEVRQEPGSPARFLVLFHSHDVRQNVLKRENHELALPGKGTFKLTVKLLPDANEVHDVCKEKIPAKESKAKEHAKEPDVMKFVEDCFMGYSVTQHQVFPRLLEATKIIRVENLPPDVDTYNLKCLF